MEIFSFWLLIVGRWALFAQFDPHLTPRVPQKGSKTVICQKWIPPLNFSCEITCLCKFSAFACHLLGDGHILTILTPTLPQLGKYINFPKVCNFA